MRMPLPPPPAEALIITGKPISSAILVASLASLITPRWPGTVETLALAASFLEFDLVAHRLDRLEFGPTKTMPRLLERAGEGRVLRQEAVAWMDRLGAGLLGRGNDLGDVEIGLAACGRADRTASSAMSTCSASRSASE